MKPVYHRGSHQVTARRLVAVWTANPATVCGFCGLTREEGIRLWGERRGRWEADHYPPGNLEGRYRPAHARCNRSAGARSGNQKRKGTGYDWP